MRRAPGTTGERTPTPNEAKIEAAVSGTDGQAALYGGAPILAVFHSSSAGLTRPAGEVWQSDLPYLQPVESPEPGGLHPQLLQPGGVLGGGVPGEVPGRLP